MHEDVRKTLDECIATCGKDAVLRALASLRDESRENILTIVTNAGQHPLRSVHSRGEVFYASEGLFDYADPGGVLVQFENALQRVAAKLRSRPWKKIYIVPFGPSTLSMQIKLLVYRILHIESIDVLHLGDDRYADIVLDQRQVVSSGDHRP